MTKYVLIDKDTGEEITGLRHNTMSGAILEGLNRVRLYKDYNKVGRSGYDVKPIESD